MSHRFSHRKWLLNSVHAHLRSRCRLGLHRDGRADYFRRKEGRHVDVRHFCAQNYLQMVATARSRDKQPESGGLNAGLKGKTQV